MKNKEVLISSFRSALDDILDFWKGKTVDQEHGGFWGRLDGEGLVVPGAAKGSVLNARILWSFSAAYNSSGDQQWLELAGRAYRYIQDHFVDKSCGGVYWAVTAEGEPLETKKQIYALAFAIYGLAEYNSASGDVNALRLAVQLYRNIEQYSLDPFKGGYLEALTKDWREIGDVRLSGKDANEKKTMNTHLHILEAYTNLYRIWPDEGLAERLSGLIKIFRDRIVKKGEGHLGLYFDEDWVEKSEVISYGHDIEASWLLTEAAEVLGDERLLEEIRVLAVNIAKASLEGLRDDGSMIYEKKGGYFNEERHWWVQAEAVVGLLNAWQLTKEAFFYTRFVAAWEYTKTAIIDPVGGEWFWGRTADGGIMRGEDKAGFWKCPYHNSRACMEAIRRLGMTAMLLLIMVGSMLAAPVLFVNQVGFDSRGPKTAVLQTDAMLEEGAGFSLIEEGSGSRAISGKLGMAQQLEEWAPGKWFYTIDFSGWGKEGRYHLEAGGCRSDVFLIGIDEPVRSMISSIIQYYHHQRADTHAELEADGALRLFGSEERVDMRGGWCDASGDVSKYFSHLAYANFMSPQQIPLVVWSMEAAGDAIPGLLDKWGLRDSLEQEALWGADYMMRSLSEEGYFRMIVFSYFKKEPDARRVVGLHANSVTTNEYQCAFREGGGMAIAALARISRWKRHGEYNPAQYLDAAKRAYAHLVVNNTAYDDDGKENIIDDYCALMAATELWIATDSGYYRDQARMRAENLAGRMTKAGYFIADGGYRPFWHASDAGLPVVALARYVSREENPLLKRLALVTIRKALDYQLAVTGEVSNPFGYPRQTFTYKDKLRNGFFIPHENETGWWWQGENARLGSLTTAALVGGRLVSPGTAGWGVDTSLARFTSRQISWILGCNPYSICFMYQFGKKNVPYMSSNYGHGSGRGGISNGITGKDGNDDGSGIDFKEEAAGNEWRWTEQWIPHAAWFLQTLAAISQ